MKTAEEILLKNRLLFECDPFTEMYFKDKNAILQVMQEYAESYHAEKVAEVTESEIIKEATNYGTYDQTEDCEFPQVETNIHEEMSFYDGLKWMHNRLMKP